jgi:hypothetical protein
MAPCRHKEEEETPQASVFFIIFIVNVAEITEEALRYRLIVKMDLQLWRERLIQKASDHRCYCVHVFVFFGASGLDVLLRTMDRPCVKLCMPCTAICTEFLHT